MLVAPAAAAEVPAAGVAAIAPSSAALEAAGPVSCWRRLPGSCLGSWRRLALLHQCHAPRHIAALLYPVFRLHTFTDTAFGMEVLAMVALECPLL